MITSPLTEPLAMHVPSLAGHLPRSWRWYRLDQNCEGIFDCPHSTPVLTDAGPYVVRTQDILSQRFRADLAAHVSEDTYQERIRRAEPRFGDLLFSREGTYFGIAAEVPSGMRICLGQRMVLLRPVLATTDPRFLKYWLNSPILASHVEGLRDGTVAERLNMPTIRALPVPLAPLPEQKRIGEILGALDAKTDLNRETNETLEAMARALFKSWFVDFDPVRAKAGVRAQHPKWTNAQVSRAALPNLEPQIAELFPDTLQDSALGKIPVGWTIGSVGEVVRAVGGGTPSTKERVYWEGGTFHWATPKDLSRLGSPILFETDRKITGAGVAAISSSLLPAGTLLLSSRAPVGYLAIANVPIAINQGFIAMVCDEIASNYFMLNWCRANMDEIERRASGTTFQEISKQNFRPILMVLPPRAIMTTFTTTAALLYTWLGANLEESRELAAIRDSLLPRLLSGELQITDSPKNTHA